MERRSLIDLISGILGGLLLVTAVVLFAVVPEEEPIPPVFQVSYVSTETTIPVDQSLSMTEGQTDSILVPLDSPYIYRIAFNLEWTDDVAASDPDCFQFKIFEPEGEQVTDPNNRRNICNEPGEETIDNQTGTDVPTATYTAVPMAYSMEKSLGAPPRDGPVPGAHLEETLDEARARLEADLATYAPGEWELEIYFGNAGDCPPNNPNSDNTRSLACNRDNGGSSEDNANNVRVVSVTYIAYEINIEEK